MKKAVLLLLAGLCLSAQAWARAVTIITNSSEIVKGDMIGANESTVFLNENGHSREISRGDIKEIFDAQTNEPIKVGPAENREPTMVQTPAPVTRDSPAKFGAVEEKNAPAPALNPDPASAAYQEPKGYLELFGHATLNNSYAIGSAMQTWMHDDIQSGSPAFANFGANGFMGLDPENTFFFGVGASMNMPTSHSIWGSSLYFGGRNELVLDPYIFSLDMPFRYAFKDSGLSVTVAPSLLMAFLSGKYSTNGNVNIDGKSVTGTFYTNMGSMGVGFGLSVGAEYYFGMLGIGVKCGLRMLESALNFDSAVGPWSPTDGKNNALNIDLSGSYMTIGAMLRFGN